MLSKKGEGSAKLECLILNMKEFDIDSEAWLLHNTSVSVPDESTLRHTDYEYWLIYHALAVVTATAPPGKPSSDP